MRNILLKLMGVGGIILTIINWWKWIEFLLGLMEIQTIGILVGIFISLIWLIGGILLTIFVGGISLVLLIED